MALNETSINQILPPAPRPIAERICACGCKHPFLPKRKDQVYFNSDHANYGYNHGKRKTKNENRNKEEKILGRNDNTMDRHFTINEVDGVAICYFEVLKADGYMFGYNIGEMEKDGLKYFFTYRYTYTLIKSHGKQTKIKITKR